MKHFCRIAAGLDTQPLLDELAANETLWNALTLRQSYPGSAHADTQSIILRGPPDARDVFNDLRLCDYAYRSMLPAANAVLKHCRALVDPLPLARVMLVRLKAGGQITPHADQGLYARSTRRYHLALQSTPDCLFSAGDETIHISPGELWWFDHHATHSVQNNGPPRVHLIFDLTLPQSVSAAA